MLMAIRACRICHGRVHLSSQTSFQTTTRLSIRLASYKSNKIPLSSSGNKPPAQITTATNNSTQQQQQPQLMEVLELLRAYEGRYTYRGWHVLRFIGIGLVTLGATVFYFWQPIKKAISREGSELAQQTMQDTNLQGEVDRITRQTTNTLLNDPKTVEVTVDFLIRLLQKPETRLQVVSFFSQVIADPATVEALAQLLRDDVTVQQLQALFNTLLNDATIRASLNDIVFALLQNPNTQRVLENMVMDLLARPNVKASTADFFGQVLLYPQVIDAATATSKNVVANLSQDEQVYKNLASAGGSAVKRMVFPGFIFRHRDGEHGKDIQVKGEMEEGSDNDESDESGSASIDEHVNELVKDQEETVGNTLPAQ